MASACSGGTGSGSGAGIGTSGVTGCSLSTGGIRSLARGFRTTRFDTAFILAAGLALRLAIVAACLEVLLLARFALAGLASRRGGLGFLRATRRTTRTAVFTAFAERGFFVFIPSCDPFGRCRIYSDALKITGVARAVQRESPDCRESPHAPLYSNSAITTRCRNWQVAEIQLTPPSRGKPTC